MATRRVAAVLSAAALGFALAACSTSTTSPSTSPTTTPATTSPSAASPTTSGSPSNVLPPIIVDGTKTTIEAKVGDTLTVTVKDVTGVSTNNDTVLTVSQPHSDGSATFYGGAEVIGAGNADLIIATKGGGAETVKVVATE